MGQLIKHEAQLLAADAERDQQQYLTFNLGGEVFAMGILAIKEIIEYGNLTEVPMMPSAGSKAWRNSAISGVFL